ncbi:hypothetical protein QTG54_001872 [Skeletonema marinoi]|uniref:Dynein intermediate chain n=1 Tax=Skeletonema marinoi TaxID=267567 RepID=A0AAD8YJU1_9STRA|nr:hypothetical protein QTG54_001872 [Skeletonema marinoi]
MEVAYVYTKRRSEFGKHVEFSNGETQILESIPPTDAYDDDYQIRTTTATGTDNTPQLSETEVNTERVVMKNTSMQHKEGGWPKDVDFTEQSDVKRFRKKVEKDEEYQYAMKQLVPLVQRCMNQNNTVNIYEEYFDGNEIEHCSEPPFAKGLAVFRDPSPVTRTATSVNWHPEGSNNGKVAVSYSVLDFQDERLNNPDMLASSYIWDVSNSNKPIVEIVPPSPLSCLRFNPKSSDTLVGGSCNGMITYYDLRKPNASSGKCLPTESSVIEKSHHDPVSDVFWISSKTGHHCVSVSTDGQMLWWDTRKLDEPTDSLVLTTDSKGNGVTLGGSCLEYSIEAGPTKFLVGTEQGIVLSLNTRNKKTNNGITVFDTGAGKHQGSIPSIQRNPTHNKYFMTVGDWTTRIWTEDLKTPIITTRHHGSYLTGGCWSPTRAGVFYVTRDDGVLDVWDISHNQNEVAYSHKVSDAALSSISVQGNTQEGGKLVAVGDVNGTVSLLEVCDSLAKPRPNEKSTINALLERETKKEKNLEVRQREIKLKGKMNGARRDNGEGEVDDVGFDEELDSLEKEFMSMTSAEL